VGKIRKTVTPLVLAANRSNSAKSTGPKTAPGKRRASRNAGKYYVFGQVTPERMRELNEDPSEFEKLHSAFRGEIQPRGGFEEMLVEEMAVNRWRLARLRRAEMALLVHKREELELRVRYPELQADERADALIMTSRGLAGITDSATKNFHILESLESLKEKVEKEGFAPQGLKILEEVYGHLPTPAGAMLIRQFNESMEGRKSAKAVNRDSLPSSGGESDSEGKGNEREAFLSGLSHEIKSHRTRYSVQMQLRTHPIPEAMFEQHLILPGKDSERFTRYEVMLQKELERLQSQLLSWRARKVA
jgi:hypothetical protein